jgi:hypothetical protein
MFGFECVAYARFILNLIDTFSFSLSKNMNNTLHPSLKAICKRSINKSKPDTKQIVTQTLQWKSNSVRSRLQ